MRLGFIHCSQRPDTWAKYYLWELRKGHPEIEVIEMAEEIGHVKHRWADTRCDAYLRIDDSGGYRTPHWMRPIILLLSDTHVPDGVDRLDLATRARNDGGYVFVAQKNAVGEVGDAWLPHAAYYFPGRPSPEYDIASIMVLSCSNPLFSARTILASRIVSEFKRARIEQGPIHEDMAGIYASSRIVWNCSVGCDVSMRCFEAAAAGACLVTDQIDDNGFDELFDELPITYAGGDDMVGKLGDALRRPDECRERGEALCNVVRRSHTYRHRLDTVLAKIREIVA